MGYCKLNLARVPTAIQPFKITLTMRLIGLKNASDRVHEKYNATSNIRCTDKLRAPVVLGLSANLANKPNPNAGCRTNYGAIKVTNT